MKWWAKIAAYVEVQSTRLKQYFVEGPALSRILRNSGFSVHMVEYVRVSESHHTGIRSAAALPPGWCVIAQQYSSVTFVSLRLHSRWVIFGAPLKMFLLQLFTVLKKFRLSQLIIF